MCETELRNLAILLADTLLAAAHGSLTVWLTCYSA